MEYSFEKSISPIIDKIIKVEIDATVLQKISSFVEELIKIKKREPQHRYDNQKEVKRFTTGYLGEAALEKILGISIIDWTIGNSSIYHIPDIPGYSVGIKTVEYGKFPIIFKKNSYPQIICIKDPSKIGTVWICGLATVDVLNECQSDELIIDPNLRERGTKTGFYGFDRLLQISSLDDIEAYKKGYATHISSYAKSRAETKRYPEKQCPRCGRKMFVKNGRYGKFWGCSGYPACSYTENCSI